MIPKYQQIKNDLLEEIRNHVFVPGDKFYSEADIKKRYSVSSITAVKALNELTSMGYLYRIQGKGTFVSKAKISKTVRFSDIENHSLDTEKIDVLSVTKENQPDVLKKLKLSKNDSYYKIVRVRSSEGIPFILNITHLPKKLMKEPISTNLSEYQSIYDRVRKDFGIDLFTQSSVETNEIVFPEDAFITNALELSFREPAVLQEKQTFLPDNSVAEYIISYKHWKSFKTKIEVEAE
ncbi:MULTISPECIES: GntR family transcriptional regulator [Vagococcus]|uniref:GntR family transcriptional regulator n=1 Tax=Vagococcus TaxID=2737 RepID=UPI000E4A1051|nr:MULTISPECIES: GntR family transcriptional regulator [Vagococcus]RHH67817.1 GntR family transcriptional regulator [Vagococcus sp. AM17-17]